MISPSTTSFDTHEEGIADKEGGAESPGPLVTASLCARGLSSRRAEWSYLVPRKTTVLEVIAHAAPVIGVSFRLTVAIVVVPAQSPLPGFGENRSALSGLPFQSSASDGGSRFFVMFGHT